MRNGDSIAQSWIEEDASPTAVQAAEGAPDAANVPTAATEYSSFGGNLGLYERTQAPGDFARWFVADWDGTRPGQATSWVRWPGDTVTLSGGTPPTIPGILASGAELLLPSLAVLDDMTGPGFVSTAGTTGQFYKWDGSTFVYQKTTANAPAPNDGALWLTGAIGAYFLPMSTPVVQADGAQWMLNTSGVTDLIANTHAAAPNAVWLLPFYDFVAAIQDSLALNSTITAYKPTWTTMQTQTITGTGTATNTIIAGAGATAIDAVGTMRGVRGTVGAVACEGVIWVATLNAVYGIQWNDQFQTWKVEELFRVPRVTGPPVDFNSEVYIPCGNRLAHINPGTKGYDWVKIDGFDTMPPPFNGRIVECVSTPDALYCKVVEESLTSVRAALMRLDTQGAWSCVYCDQATNSTLARMPLVKTADKTNPPAIGMWVDATHIRLFPTQDSGRNPRTMSVAARQQRGTVRGVTCWETGVARSNQKQLLRYRLEVEDLGNKSVKVYYQLPVDAYPGATDTFATGAAANTGTWHLCGNFTASSTGYSGSLDAGGNGWVWIEFDGQTSYGGGVGVLSQYPDYTAVRWCIEIEGDTTGTHVPTLRGFRTDREEYISKAKVITARVDLTAGMRQRGQFDDAAGATDTVRDAAWVQSEMAFIEGLVTGKHAQTLVTPKINPATGTNYTYQVSITKWQEVPQDMNDDGIQGARVQLSMKVLPLLGVL